MTEDDRVVIDGLGHFLLLGLNYLNFTFLILNFFVDSNFGNTLCHFHSAAEL